MKGPQQNLGRGFPTAAKSLGLLLNLAPDVACRHFLGNEHNGSEPGLLDAEIDQRWAPIL